MRCYNIWPWFSNHMDKLTPTMCFRRSLERTYKKLLWLFKSVFKIYSSRHDLCYMGHLKRSSTSNRTWYNHLSLFWPWRAFLSKYLRNIWRCTYFSSAKRDKQIYITRRRSLLGFRKRFSVCESASYMRFDIADKRLENTKNRPISCFWSNFGWLW